MNVPVYSKSIFVSEIIRKSTLLLISLITKSNLLRIELILRCANMSLFIFYDEYFVVSIVDIL